MQVVFGFADEFVHLLESRGGLTAPVRYGKTYTRVHDPMVWREAADHVLREAGVQVLFHTTVTSALLDGDRVEGLMAYSKEGRSICAPESRSTQAATPTSLRWLVFHRSSGTRDAFRTRP